MKKKNKIMVSLNHITKIKIYERLKNNNFKPTIRNNKLRNIYRSFLGKELLEDSQRGFYTHYEITKKFLNQTDIEDMTDGNSYIDMNGVYYFPFIRMYLDNGTIVDKHFETVDKLYEFINSDDVLKIKLVEI